MSGSTSIPLSEAKTNFSSIVRKVRDAGEKYTITLRNSPVAMVVPVQTDSPSKSITRGILSEYSDSDKRIKEKDAFAKAMEAKHAHAS